MSTHTAIITANTYATDAATFVTVIMVLDDLEKNVQHHKIVIITAFQTVVLASVARCSSSVLVNCLPRTKVILRNSFKHKFVLKEDD